VIPGAARALRKGPDAVPGERAPLDKALEKPHTRVAEVPQGTPGVPQRPQRRTGREATSLTGPHRGDAAKALAETANSWRQALMQRRAGHDRETTASSGGSPLARLATCLVLREEGDAFETSVRPPCGERMQRVDCVQIPGLNAPFALALPEQRVDLGGSCASSTAATSCRIDEANSSMIAQTHEAPV